MLLLLSEGGIFLFPVSYKLKLMYKPLANSCERIRFAKILVAVFIAWFNIPTSSETLCFRKFLKVFICCQRMALFSAGIAVSHGNGRYFWAVIFEYKPRGLCSDIQYIQSPRAAPTAGR